MSDTLLIHCDKCGATNRVPRDKAEQLGEPVCGRCKSRLSLASKPVIVTDSTFAHEVEHSPIPVLVDIWADWCGPCRMIAPSIEQLSAEMSGRVRFAKVNIDENPGIATRFGVRSIPTMLVMKAGKEVDRIVGAQPKTEIKRRLESILGNVTV
jgi:thioredoxin 2